MYKTSKKLKKTAKLLLVLLATSNAYAVQVIEGADSKHVEVMISAKEQNRLSMSGARIATVVPSKEGVLSYKKDEATGSLYFGLNETGQGQAGSITLFVSDDNGAMYTLLLVPRPIAGEDIVVKAAQGATVQQTKNKSVLAGDGRSGSHVRRIKELTLSMADELERNTGETMNREVALWEEARLVYISKHVESDLVGEKYSLTNVSKTMMVLSEQEFYRKGVYAVSIEVQTLAPGETSMIFIVRKGKDNE